MSIRLMSKVWDSDLPTTDKMVMLALADWSNDQGQCWPSIAQLCVKSGMSERAVQGALKRLDDSENLTRIMNKGKGTHYTLHPRSKCTPDPRTTCATTPAANAPPPPQQMRLTPAADAPNTPITIKVRKRDTNVSPRASAVRVFPKPDWADAQVWSDFLANRKAKRAPNTTTAYKRFMSDIAKHADSEWPPPRLLEHAVARGWAGIYDPRGADNGRSGTNTVARDQSRGIGRTTAAALSVIERLDRIALVR